MNKKQVEREYKLWKEQVEVNRRFLDNLKRNNQILTIYFFVITCLLFIIVVASVI